MNDDTSNRHGKAETNDSTTGGDDGRSKHPLSRRVFVGGTLLGLAGAVPTAVSSAASGDATAVASGAWDDPSTWDGGTVPEAGDSVAIQEGVNVTLGSETPRLDRVHVDGTLAFDPDADSHLRADTLMGAPGSSVVMGTSDRPIAADVEARVTFVDTGAVDNSNPDAMEQGRGLLISGDLTVHGAEKTSWTTLASHPTAGDAVLELSETPTNWREGDQVVVPGVNPDADEDEERTVAAVDESANSVELDAALEFDHAPPKSNLDAYALNLTRNAVFASESTELDRRGHGMVMSTATDVRYAAFEDMGRTDKSRPFSDPVRGSSPEDANVKARYPFHFHHTGIGADPHHVVGCVANGAPGWGFVNHHAHAHVTDCVTYDVLGAGFVAEGGNERGSFKRNFALRSEGSGETIDSRAAGDHGDDPAIDDFGHAGHGFWLQSPLVEVVDNVAAGHRHQAFVWWLRPMLEGDLAEGSSVEDSRVTYWPNLPVEYADVDRPLWEAIEDGRFANGENNNLMVETGKIPSTFATVATISGNTAFAAAGGVDFSRHNFKWEHERFSDFTVVDDMTVYNVGEFVDADGEVHTPDLPRHRASGNQGRGGSTGVAFRYTSNVRLTNSTIIGSGRENSVGVPFHDYRWTNLVDNCTIEGWDWGVDTGEHRTSWVRNNSFSNNTYDVNWSFDNVGPGVFDDNDLQSVRFDFERRNQKASEIFEFDRDQGVRVDGRTAYVEEAVADHVPFPDADSLDSVNNLEDVFPDEDDLVGKTNAELQDEYGYSIGGAIAPDDAVTEPWLDGAVIDPAAGRATHAYVDVADGNTGGGWEVVDETDASDGTALRCTESGTSGDLAASTEFDVGESGSYELWVRAQPDSWNGDSISVRVDGGEWLTAEKLKSPIGFEWFDVSPNGGETYVVDLSAGTHTLELTSDSTDVLVDEVYVSADATTLGAYGVTGTTEAPDEEEPESDQQPYADHDLAKIQAEDFDTGGEGVAYHDTSDGNNGGAYRDTNVDVEETSDGGGGHNVGWIEDGEWWEYTVDVPEGGEYDLVARVAGKSNPAFDVAVDGSQVASVAADSTGGWQTWETVDAGTVGLEAGTRTVRVTATGGSWNFNWFGFRAGGSTEPAAPGAPSNLSASNATDAAVDLSWDAPDETDGIDHYAVYQDGSQATETSETSVTVEGLAPETTYEFHVTAVDGEGTESDPSNTVSVTTAAASKTVEVTGNGAAGYNDDGSVRYIIETSGTIESGGRLEASDMFGGSKAVGSVAADGSDTDTYELTDGEVTDVSTWGGDLTVTVDGTEL